MKKLLIIGLLAISATVFGQANEMPFSTIYIIRGANFVGGGCTQNINLPNQREFTLGVNSIIQYKVYSEGDISITMFGICPASGYVSASTFTDQVMVGNVKRGNEYFVLSSTGKFKEITKEDGRKYLEKIKRVSLQEENLDLPINKNSLKDIAKKEGKGQATCFLIGDDGYMITNYHCVEHAKEIFVKGIDGDFTTKYGATLVASDPSNDLALIKVDNKNIKFSPTPFAIKSNGVYQAEKIYAMGFPIAEVMGKEVKITEGIISAKSGQNGDISKFQISAALNPGNSGGPLIDEQGNLIGVIYAKSSIAESSGYALKASYLETFLKNVDAFQYATMSNTMSEKSFYEKVDILKGFIFILETN